MKKIMCIIGHPKRLTPVSSCNDYDFENKIKAICHKKKQLFSIKCDEMNKARKFNGEIKYNIREIRNKRDSILRNLDYSINQIKKVI